MKRLDYHDKERAKVFLMRELQKTGWLCLGYKEDRSDSMTDYYDPASWDGIATQNGLILCVDISAYFVGSRSGMPEIKLIPQAGEAFPKAETLFTWPVFHVTPRGNSWHIEKDGVILAKGSGLAKCLQENLRHIDPSGLAWLAARINQAAAQIIAAVNADWAREHCK